MQQSRKAANPRESLSPNDLFIVISQNVLLPVRYGLGRLNIRYSLSVDDHPTPKEGIMRCYLMFINWLCS
jgi:hypothetical protein